jgi:hypothetical protein
MVATKIALWESSGTCMLQGIIETTVINATRSMGQEQLGRTNKLPPGRKTHKKEHQYK